MHSQFCMVGNRSLNEQQLPGLRVASRVEAVEIHSGRLVIAHPPNGVPTGMLPTIDE